MERATLQGGFSDPAPMAARAFRAILNAMARPGRIESITGANPPEPLSPAAGAVLLTLCDVDTPLHIAGAGDTQAVRDWVRFYLGAPLVAAEEATFALGSWSDLLPLSAYRQGTPDYPDRSATLIVEVATLVPEGPILRGPGIRDTARLSLPETDAFRANHALYPLGLDFLFTCAERVAALPRSTEVA